RLVHDAWSGWEDTRVPDAGAGGRERSLAELLVDESPDALIALTPEGDVRLWNRGAQTMFGYTPAEAVGRRLEQLTVPENFRGEARRAREHTLEHGSVLFETTRRHKGGALMQVDVSMRRVDPPAGATFIAVSTKDVTPLHRLKEVQASELKFRNLLE